MHAVRIALEPTPSLAQPSPALPCPGGCASQLPRFLMAAPTVLMSVWGVAAYAAACPHLILTGGLVQQGVLRRWFPACRGEACALAPALSVGLRCSAGSSACVAGNVRSARQESAAAAEASGPGLRCTCAGGRGFYSARLAPLVLHWAAQVAVCVAVVHIEVSTRLLSSCAPLYWFAAQLLLAPERCTARHRAAWKTLSFALWWYALSFMGVGVAYFPNFLPWT